METDTLVFGGVDELMKSRGVGGGCTEMGEKRV